MRMGAGDPLFDIGAYNALADRVRRAGGGDNIGGRNQYDILKLIDLDKKIAAGEAARIAAQPLNDAAALFNQAKQRAYGAVAKVNEYQKILVAQRRLHEIHGATSDMFEAAPIPEWPEPGPKSIEEYVAAAEKTLMDVLAMESRAHKMRSYLSTWNVGGMPEQNRRMIMALADRLDRIEARGA